MALPPTTIVSGLWGGASGLRRDDGTSSPPRPTGLGPIGFSDFPSGPDDVGFSDFATGRENVGFSDLI